MCKDHMVGLFICLIIFQETESEAGLWEAEVVIPQRECHSCNLSFSGPSKMQSDVKPHVILGVCLD